MTQSLIQRLEEATEGSRELDEAVFCALHRIQAPGTLFIGPHYTTSLDAAMTLVPDEGWLTIAHRRDGKEKVCRAGFDHYREPYSFYGTAATFPLALCVACLKVRAEAR